MRREEGFGLIEVIIAMGISTTLVLGTMTLTEYSMKSARNANLSSDFNNISSNIRMLLNDEALCSGMMMDLPYPLGDGKTTPLQELSIRGTPVLKLNKPIGGLKATQLEIVGLPVLPGDAAVAGIGNILYLKVPATLRVTVEKTGQIMGSRMLTKEFQINTLVEPTTLRIKMCFGEVSKTEIVSAVRAQIKREVCEELGGGFEQASGRCTPVSVKNLVSDNPSNPMQNMNSSAFTQGDKLSPQPATANRAPAQIDDAEVGRQLKEAQQQLQQKIKELQQFSN